MRPWDKDHHHHMSQMQWQGQGHTRIIWRRCGGGDSIYSKVYLKLVSWLNWKEESFFIIALKKINNFSLFKSRANSNNWKWIDSSPSPLHPLKNLLVPINYMVVLSDVCQMSGRLFGDQHLAPSPLPFTHSMDCGATSDHLHPDSSLLSLSPLSPHVDTLMMMVVVNFQSRSTTVKPVA